MNHPRAIWRFSSLFCVLRIRLNTTSARNTGRITLVNPNSPEAMACRTCPKAPWTRNHSDAQNSTARMAMMKHAMSRRYLRSMPAIGEESTSSMTLVSPERDLPAEPLPPDFGLEDAVRAITGLDFTHGHRHGTTTSDTYRKFLPFTPSGASARRYRQDDAACTHPPARRSRRNSRRRHAR